MELMRTEYEFLDLSDVKAADLDKLQYALYDTKIHITTDNNSGSWDSHSLDLSPGSSSTAAPTSGAGGAAGGGGGEAAGASLGGEMSARPSAPPPPYAPPAYAPPHQQWPVAPPNVYVSQVTANVNVHGYMGQYYQPQPAAAFGGGGERAQRPHRRERRGKRPPSPPPPAPPPYYLQYPQYYAPPQQGAPLYHMPVYQPLVYPPYAYPPYAYPEYVGPVEADDKVDDYRGEAEALMEAEAVEAYYAGPYVPPYPPPEPHEYVPPAPAAPLYLPPPPPPILHQPQPHQFNVHAKNFVLSAKPFVPAALQQQQDKSPPATVSATAGVESLPLKELKINKGTTSPKHTPATASAEVSIKPADKFTPPNKPEMASAKSTWLTNEVKPQEPSAVATQTPQAVKAYAPATVSANQSVGPAKVTPQIVKVPKGPAAPFSGAKQPPKPIIAQASVPVPHVVSTPKAPFGNRQKRDGPNRSPSAEASTEAVERPVDHVKREPLLPASKAPLSVSITIQSQGPPLIVSKAPFGHARKAALLPEVVAPPPPPPAPTASDFPPPPTPRHRTDPAPGPAGPTQAPAPPPGKSWASLFNKSSLGSPAPAPMLAPTPVAPAPAPAPLPVAEEPPSPTTVTPPATQKPVAKVLPYDASPLQQQVVPEKSSPSPRSISSTSSTSAPLSYSEKTSVNAVSYVAAAKPASPSQPVPTQPEVKEVPIQKEPHPPLPVQPSPFADDPNSYRMGEFLSKYQLDNRPVALVPRGLTNRSNYCYVNAILQALIACPPFYNMLKALPYQTRRGKSSTPIIDAMVELCYEFTLLPPNARVSRARGTEGTAGPLPIQTGPPVDPSAGQKVLRALRPFPGSQEGRQEDAEEFLSCLLNGLNDEMLELMKLVEPDEPKEVSPPNGIVEPEAPPEEDYDDVEWKVMGPRNRGAIERLWAAGRTPLADLFRGRTRCRLHRAPRSPTDALHPFFTLQLDMERTNNVKDALDLLAGKDTLEGVSDAWQQLSIEQLPNILLLHLKCFQLDPEGHTAKIVKNFEFPIDLKIDPKIMSSKQKYTSKQRMYKLFAVVYHEGVEATKGHYVTDTYHGQAGWIRYDDSTVTLVNDAQVLKPKPPRMPYLLMYRRADNLPVPHRSTPKPE